jgi:hypothetical protein
LGAGDFLSRQRNNHEGGKAMMQHKIPCEMVRDILPLYVDGLTSDETNNELEQHMKYCEPCTTVCQDMQTEFACEKEKNVDDGKKEINYLKKIRKNNHKKIAIGIIGAVLILIIAVAVKLYIIGYPTDAYHVTNMEIQGNAFRCKVQLDDNATYKGWDIIEGDNGEQKAVFYVRRPSFFSQYHYTQVSILLETIPSTLNINGNIVHRNGVIVSKLANDLFAAKNKYVGDISANLQISNILEIANDLGGYKNQLQTATKPYGWTLEFEKTTSNPAGVDGKMKNYACVLMALIDNIGEVHWSYNVTNGTNPGPHINGMTQAQCSAYVGGPIKSFSESPEKVQQLLDFLEIRN